VQNEKIEITTYQHKVIEIKNEYDTDNVIEVIKENNPMMIRGVFQELVRVIYVRKW
jgi:hypothetical protein